MNAVLARAGGMVVYYWLAGMLNKLSTISNIGGYFCLYCKWAVLFIINAGNFR
jgi:hypothetical protein